MANFISGVIGTAGQEALGTQLANMVSKEVCEGIRKAFQGPLLEEYKRLLTSASEKLENTEILTDTLTSVFKSIKINLNIKGGSSGLIGGGGGEENKNPDPDPGVNNTRPPIPPIENPFSMDMTKKMPEIPGGKANDIDLDIPSMKNTFSADMDMDMTKKMPEIPGAKEFTVITDAVKTVVGGLSPGEDAIPEILKEALNKDTIGKMLEDGIKNLMDYMKDGGKDELVKMFIGVLKERINDNYKANDAKFKAAITTAINGKCPVETENTMDPDNPDFSQENPATDNGGNLQEQEINLGGGRKSKKRTTRKNKIYK